MNAWKIITQLKFLFIASSIVIIHPLMRVHNQIRLLFGLIGETPPVYILLPFIFGSIAGVLT
jgi:hypothetical protein